MLVVLIITVVIFAIIWVLFMIIMVILAKIFEISVIVVATGEKKLAQIGWGAWQGRLWIGGLSFAS